MSGGAREQSFDVRQAERWNPWREQAESLAARLPPLLVAAESLASTAALGVHGRRKAGMGETFWQFRRFRAEDSSAAVDWRQSAKSQHLFVREREWEAAESVWLWRDGSPGMRFAASQTGITKIERATVLALALGSLLVRGGERIALAGDGYPPSGGRFALRRIAHELTDISPGDDPLPPEIALRRNAEFVWFSDFLLPLDALEARIRRFARAGVCGYLVQVIDPAEEDFPFTGRTRFEAVRGAATKTLTETFGRAESVRDAYRARFAAHAEAIGMLTRRLGWSFLRHRTDKSPQTALVALYSALGGARARKGF